MRQPRKTSRQIAARNSRYGYDYTTGEGQKRLMYESVGIDIHTRMPTPDYYEAGEDGSDPILDEFGEPTGRIRMHPTGRIVDLARRNGDRYAEFRDPNSPHLMQHHPMGGQVLAYIDRHGDTFCAACAEANDVVDVQVLAFEETAYCTHCARVIRPRQNSSRRVGLRRERW